MAELKKPVLKALLKGFEPTLALRHSELKGSISSTFGENTISFADATIAAVFKETVDEYQLDKRQIELEQKYINVLSKMRPEKGRKEYDILSATDKSGNSRVWYMVDDIKSGGADRETITDYIHQVLSPGYMQRKENERVKEKNEEPYFKNSITVVDRFLLTALDMRLAEKLVAQDQITPHEKSRMDKDGLLHNLAILEKYFLDMANGSHKFFSTIAEIMDIQIEEPQKPPHPQHALFQ